MRQLAACHPRADWFRHGGAPAGAVLDFSTGINPLGPPRSVLEALCCAVTTIARYPDPASTTLVESLAARHDVHPDQVVVGNGSCELIQALPRVLRARRLAIVEPTFTEYLRASLAAGCTVEHWFPNDDALQPSAFDVRGADLVWVCNPNNPTGRLWKEGELASWAQRHGHTTFVVDEAYLPFLDDEADHTQITLLRHGVRNVIVLRSLTKLYSLPGLRLGYAVLDETMAARLREALPAWPVNALAQAAGLAALHDEPFVRATRGWLAQARGHFVERMRRLPGVRLIPSRAPFILLQLARPIGPLLARGLLADGLAVRDASNFVGLDEHALRVLIRSPEDQQRLFNLLGPLLEPEGSR